ncbi:CoxG family protein [Spirosoma spitsbergense]|jgi:carbon monoxide dehydrogenase subunit G|uniref:CoxG family protein n=1 Tax=Spirosoma spitsbergense TaxID=431554 RepID=UPI000476CACB|nr:carbon monoxide dehydrogenase subunit G [Spirosoma spitsbergense]
MQLSGTHVLNAPVGKVWTMLMDPVTLARIVPAVSSLELIDDNQYKALAEIKMGPVSGSFSGNLSLLNIREKEGYSLHVKQASKIGNADALINIALKSLDDDQTELTFDGDARLSGLLARTGQRVISGVANTLTKQFFANFDEALSNEMNSVE